VLKSLELVKITLECVKITLRAEITLMPVFYIFKNLNIYLKIDTHACEFHTQTCHIHTLDLTNTKKESLIGSQIEWKYIII
jgi:hypothetical protein